MRNDDGAAHQAALEIAQAQVAAATDEVEGIGLSLVDRALSDIDVDDAAAAADRALQSLREIQEALDATATILRSGHGT